jgi:serine protease AprX
MKQVLTAIVLSVLSAHPTFAGGAIGPRLAETLRSTSSDQRQLVWVYLADKGADVLQKTATPSLLVSERSLERRRNVLPPDKLVDETDVPVNAAYIRDIAATGAEIQHRSKWLNAASVLATPEQVARIAALPFVREVELTGRFRKRDTEPAPEKTSLPAEMLQKQTSTHVLDYGLSFNQINQINVPPLHDAGNTAQGVIVGVFDNGFRLPNHEAFASMNILATYDFVDHKVSVVPVNTASNFGDHGVNTLSTIGGFKPGVLIGPAYGATYILARTENDSSETPLEEDKWVAAIEWADSIGVQVTSTSLGYLDYDPPYTSWTWLDMNGRTAVVTRAAAIAVRKGILVVNSAGNEGFNPSHNTLDAPADGDSVLAAGAVDPAGNRASFSSVGPSTANPPRIKPDVMAQGVSVLCASAFSPTGYIMPQGTSFSCPLAAGVAALLIKAHPNAPPMKIVEAMKLTANNAAAPNNSIGWGILNATEASNHLNLTDTGAFGPQPLAYLLEQNYPNPFNPGTAIIYDLPEPAFVTLTVHDLLGRTVRVLVNGQQSGGRRATVWNGADTRGTPVASGAYIYRMVATGTGGTQTVLSKRMMVIR